jgi:hypothetical protein
MHAFDSVAYSAYAVLYARKMFMKLTQDRRSELYLGWQLCSGLLPMPFGGQDQQQAREEEELQRDWDPQGQGGAGQVIEKS